MNSDIFQKKNIEVMELKVYQYQKETYIYLIDDKTSESYQDTTTINMGTHLQKIGYVHFVVNPSECEVNLCYLYVAENFRGKKLAEKLMDAAIRYCYETMKENEIEVFEIKLDDMSSRFNQKNNIYKKFGFEYCGMDEDGPSGPEMSLTIEVLF